MKRYSTKMHGAWVRSKITSEEGRISYFDRKTDLVWVVWEPSRNQKTVSASGLPATDLVYLRQYEHEPFFRKELTKD